VPPGGPSRKILAQAQVLDYTYITVKFQLQNSINLQLTECSLYNRFCIESLKGPPKWGFGGILRGGAKIFGGTPPRNAMTTELCRLVKKIVKML